MFTVILSTAARTMQGDWTTDYAESTPARPFKSEAGARKRIQKWMQTRLFL